MIKYLDVVGKDLCMVLNEPWKTLKSKAMITKTQVAQVLLNLGGFSSARFDPQRLQCFFCEEYGCPKNLHCASTLQVTKDVRDCAVLLNGHYQSLVSSTL